MTRALLLGCFALVACSTPAPVNVDAGTGDAGSVDGGAGDAGPAALGWRSGPDYPSPIAFGSALILPFEGEPYLYVIGGVEGSFASLGTFHAEIRRAHILPDDSLGPWEDAGQIETRPGVGLTLAGHGAIRIVGETGEQGMALAGGGNDTVGALPVVLGGYAQADGSIGLWGRFDPMISAEQGGQSFGTFDALEAHQLALVGGMQGSTPSDHVIIAAILNGAMAPTWRDGPSLPAPRFGHASISVGSGAPDIFLAGGANIDGASDDVLVTVRDASMEVTGWATAGSLGAPAVFPAAANVGEHLYVLGGVAGDPNIDELTAAVRVATIGASPSGRPTLSAFELAPTGALPEGRAGALYAVRGPTIYLVGGLTGSPATASASVVYGRLE